MGVEGSESDHVTTEWGARAASYAAYAVPKNRPFAQRLVQLVRPVPGEEVLDIATGPGVVAIEAARAMGGKGTVLATDFAPEWEPFVRDATREASVDNVSFRCMPAEALTLADDAFDVVLCQFGLMFVPDPIAALTEMRRVLRPHGRLGVAVWSTPDKVGHFVPLRTLVAALPPADGPPAASPTSLGEPGLIESLVARGGFADIATERVTRTHDITDAEEEWGRLSEERRFATRLQDLEEDRLRAIKQRVIEALEQHRAGPIIRLQSEAILVTASRHGAT